MKNISYKRYIETFHVLEKYSQEYGYQLKHLLKETETLKDGFSILDIGAGRGVFALSLLKNCKKKVSSYTAIELSVSHIKELNQHFAKAPLEKNIIKAKFTPQTVFKRKFDLIIMSHSVYWFVPNIYQHLKNALRFLNKNGKLVIYLQSFATFCYVLNGLFRAKDPIYIHKISSRELTQILDKFKIPYNISYLPGTLKADNFLKAKNKKLLHDLLSFCLFAEVKQLGAKDLKLAEDFTRLFSYKTNSGYKLNLSVGAITITK